MNVAKLAMVAGVVAVYFGSRLVDGLHEAIGLCVMIGVVGWVGWWLFQGETIDE